MTNIKFTKNEKPYENTEDDKLYYAIEITERTQHIEEPDILGETFVINGKAEVVLDDKVMDLQDAVDEDLINSYDILTKCREDVHKGIINFIVTRDGNTQIFQYPEVSIIKCDGKDSEDLYIGEADLTLGEVNAHVSIESLKGMMGLDPGVYEYEDTIFIYEGGEMAYDAKTDKLIEAYIVNGIGAKYIQSIEDHIKTLRPMLIKKLEA